MSKVRGRASLRKAEAAEAGQSGEQPPKGFVKMPKSRHGGYVSRDGKRHWYPSQSHARRAHRSSAVDEENSMDAARHLETEADSAEERGNAERAKALRKKADEHREKAKAARGSRQGAHGHMTERKGRPLQERARKLVKFKQRMKFAEELHNRGLSPLKDPQKVHDVFDAMEGGKSMEQVLKMIDSGKIGKSLSALVGALRKARGYPVGTVRTRKDGSKWKKTKQGKWSFVGWAGAAHEHEDRPKKTKKTEWKPASERIAEAAAVLADIGSGRAALTEGVEPYKKPNKKSLARLKKKLTAAEREKMAAIATRSRRAMNGAKELDSFRFDFEKRDKHVRYASGSVAGRVPNDPASYVAELGADRVKSLNSAMSQVKDLRREAGKHAARAYRAAVKGKAARKGNLAHRREALHHDKNARLLLRRSRLLEQNVNRLMGEAQKLRKQSIWDERLKHYMIP